MRTSFVANMIGFGTNREATVNEGSSVSHVHCTNGTSKTAPQARISPDKHHRARGWVVSVLVAYSEITSWITDSGNVYSMVISGLPVFDRNSEVGHRSLDECIGGEWGRTLVVAENAIFRALIICDCIPGLETQRLHLRSERKRAPFRPNRGNVFAAPGSCQPFLGGGRWAISLVWDVGCHQSPASLRVFSLRPA